MDKVEVDVEEVGLTWLARADDMAVPQLLGQGAWCVHGVLLQIDDLSQLLASHILRL